MLESNQRESLEKQEVFSSCDLPATSNRDPVSGASTPVEKAAGWAPFFSCALLFVGAVSFYDGYLVVRTGDMIEDFEKNPVGLYLIKMDNGDPSVFLRAKAAGTIIALAGLIFLYRCSRRLASPVVCGLLAFQTGLLIFLEGPFR